MTGNFGFGNTRESIDALVSTLSKEYDLRKTKELKRLARDKGITIIYDRSVMIPCAAPTIKVIFLPRHSISRGLHLAHEIGHVLLEHHKYPTISLRESEAVYFQTQVGYPYNFLNTFIAYTDDICRLISNPAYFWKASGDIGVQKAKLTKKYPHLFSVASV